MGQNQSAPGGGPPGGQEGKDKVLGRPGLYGACRDVIADSTGGRQSNGPRRCLPQTAGSKQVGSGRPLLAARRRPSCLALVTSPPSPLAHDRTLPLHRPLLHLRAGQEEEV